MRAIQAGSIHAYLAYIFVTLIAAAAVRGAPMIGRILHRAGCSLLLLLAAGAAGQRRDQAR